MKKLILLITALAISHIIILSQPCLPEGIIFQTQEQIDNFQINYPGCTEIEGTVQIQNYDGIITNLNGLNALTIIGGGLYITNNYNLNSLAGLQGLITLGGYLEISSNHALFSLTGLENIDPGSIIYLKIADNTSLSTCEVQSICDYLASPNGIVDIFKNETGCNNPPEVANVCGFTIPCLPFGNYYFVTQSDIDNFQDNYPGCTQLEGDVQISGSDITNLNGLSVVTSIGGNLMFTGNNSLTSLTGLEGLTSIGGNLNIGDYWFGNPALISLTGLNNLTSIGGNLNIVGNDALNTLSGMDNIIAGSIANLCVSYNNSLSNCEVQSVCDYLASPNGIVNILNNANGCNNPAEVANACGINLPCLPYGNYYFYSQTDIDNFQINYPGCAELEGHCSIFGNNITNLNGLSMLTSIGGELWIYSNQALTSLTGLEDVTFIGGDLWIEENGALSSLAGLEGLTSIGGGLAIYNSTLTNLTGLDNLTYIGNYLNFHENENLINLMGLDNVTSIGGDLDIAHNNNLNNLTGLNALTSIGGNLHIGMGDGNIALTSLTGLEYLTSIGGNLWIQGNNLLTNLTGLEHLISIGGNLSLVSNSWLNSIEGLNDLTSIGGTIYIINSNALASLTGLGNIQPNSITSLYIASNYSLSDCDVQSICDYLAIPNAQVYIIYNAPGCNSQEEVAEHCLTTVEEIKTGNGITIIPNPSSDQITISLPALTSITQLSILNVNGEKVIERQLTDNEIQIDISPLPRGVYFVRLQNEKMVKVEKLIKD